MGNNTPYSIIYGVPLKPVQSPDALNESIIAVAGSGSGTGWFCRPDVVVTAAHVIGGSKNGTIYPKGKSYPASANYSTSHIPKSGSTEDFVWLSSTVKGKPLSVSILNTKEATISIVGISDGEYLESEGDAYATPEGILVYKVSAADGFSGAPIFYQGKVIGIHLGSATETSLNVSLPVRTGYSNAGLLFTQQTLDFLSGN